MSDQLSLDAEAPRLHTCCGTPCAPLGESGYPDYPHTEDCPNPNIGTWFDRWGRPMMRLWCSDTARRGGPCPYNGDPPSRLSCCRMAEVPARADTIAGWV